eukprot:SM000026S08969  [mRNA]  locus=s26:706723:707624:- [translate_table: standard]
MAMDPPTSRKQVTWSDGGSGDAAALPRSAFVAPPLLAVATPQPYVVTIVTPPPRHLGTHALPPNTQCGETVTVSGEPYIVSGVTYCYQLRRGRYEPAQQRLEVQSTGRYLVNLFLDDLMDLS